MVIELWRTEARRVACGEISHRHGSEEGFAVTKDGHVSEEELEFDINGYIIFNGVVEKSYREPSSSKKLHDGISMSEEDNELVGAKDVFEFSIMGKEMELFTVLVVFDPDRVLAGGHVVCHCLESSVSGDAAGFWEWLGATRVPHGPSVLGGMYSFRFSSIHVGWIALVRYNHQGSSWLWGSMSCPPVFCEHRVTLTTYVSCFRTTFVWWNGSS